MRLSLVCALIRFVFHFFHNIFPVGYSAPDAFFGECWSGIGILVTESLVGVVMNSFTLTILYQVSAGGGFDQPKLHACL